MPLGGVVLGRHIAGDVDDSGVIDAADGVAFTDCMSGPSEAATCDAGAGDRADLDDDGDADPPDLAGLQSTLPIGPA